MKLNATERNTESRIIPWRRWLEGVGVSPVTGWRWRNNGWLHPLNINGKLYITAQEIANFERRAAAGEFEKLAQVPKANRN